MADGEVASEIYTPEKTLVHTDVNFSPNTFTPLKMMDTLLVTSIECERPIIMLKLIKSRIWSTKGQERLNG